jgi:hypothetical protein
MREKLHESTYQYLQPSPDQMMRMDGVRDAAKKFSDILEQTLPEGPDKTHALRLHRTAAMWANIAITRNPDGSPRRM